MEQMNDSAPLNDSAALLAALSLEEKAALLDGADFWHTKGVERLGVPGIMVSDGPHGLRKQASAGDHLGLTNSVPATCFPPAAGIASSWDVDLLHRVGVALGVESRAAEVSVLLGPGINMKRSPLCGRNFEYLSEDPTLAGALAAAMVQGVQSQGVGTSLKHFAVNNQETDRMTVSAEVDERTLREIYLAAFEHVVKTSQPWTIMCSYNRLNGRYVSEHPWLLTEVLRDEWGFEGLVMSDWGAVSRRDAAVAAGMDLEMPSSGGGGTRVILDAVRAGTLSEADVDRAAARVLALAERSKAALADPGSFDRDTHHALAREAAAASAVLLKNEGGLLPLDPASGGTIALIGDFARTSRFQGAGSSQVNPTRVDTSIEALQQLLGSRREVVFAPGFGIESASADPAQVEEAVRVAEAADVVVLFLGLPPSYESEGYDRTGLELPASQVELLHAVADVNPRVVVVLSNGAVVEVASWEHRAMAVLEGWLLGQAGGSALIDILFGAVEPSGRLAETIPVRLEDTPAFGNFPGAHHVVRHGEGTLIGYRWYDTRKIDVSHPFGHGLSYTTFGYRDLEVVVRVDGPDPVVDVAVTVANTGTRRGIETVQLYVADPVATVQRAEQELRGFSKVALEPGEERRVTFTLDARAFAFWHEPLHQWIVEGGEFEIRVGASSRDIRVATTIDLAGEPITLPLDVECTVDEWLAHPKASAWLLESLGDGQFSKMMFNPTHGQMFRAIPLQRLSRMPYFPVSEAEVEAAVARFS
ncbi:MAG: hypothetical protein RJA49_965 [Actinomycetota bacterium]